jgi:hypothetical protein
MAINCFRALRRLRRLCGKVIQLNRGRALLTLPISQDMEVIARGQGKLRLPLSQKLDQRIHRREARSLPLAAGIQVSDVLPEADDGHAVWNVGPGRPAILHDPDFGCETGLVRFRSNPDGVAHDPGDRQIEQHDREVRRSIHVRRLDHARKVRPA